MTEGQSELLKTLHEIAELDAALIGIQAEAKKVQSEIAVRLQSNKKREADLALAKKALLDKRAAEDREEKRIRDERSKLEGRRAALATLNDYKSQLSAEREIDHSAKELDEHEESTLKMLQEVEDLEKKLKDLEVELAASLKEYEAAYADALALIKTLDGRLKEKSATRKSLAAGLEKTVLDNYERARAKYPQDPLAHIENGTCVKCFMQVGPQVVVEIQKGMLNRCRGCGRILFL